MCIHLSFSSSPILAAVSLSVCRSVAVFGLPAVISVSSSCSVGMNGSPFSSVYFGGVYVAFMNFA